MNGSANVAQQKKLFFGWKNQTITTCGGTRRVFTNEQKRKLCVNCVFADVICEVKEERERRKHREKDIIRLKIAKTILFRFYQMPVKHEQNHRVNIARTELVTQQDDEHTHDTFDMMMEEFEQGENLFLYN